MDDKCKLAFGTEIVILHADPNFKDLKRKDWGGEEQLVEWFVKSTQRGDNIFQGRCHSARPVAVRVIGPHGEVNVETAGRP